MGVNLLVLLKAMYAVIHSYIYVCMGRFSFFLFFSFSLSRNIYWYTLSSSIYTSFISSENFEKRRVCTKLLRAFNNLRLLKSAEEKDILTKQNLGARVFLRVNYGILIKKI